MTGDDENPEWTADDFAKSRPGAELPPEILASFPNTRASVLPGQLEQLAANLKKADGEDCTARAHLAAGRVIYYVEADTPASLLIKEYQDGRRELVRFHREGDEVVRVL
jgi:hypothetical protein